MIFVSSFWGTVQMDLFVRGDLVNGLVFFEHLDDGFGLEIG